MRTGRGRRGWTRARGSSLPGLRSLAPTGRSAGAAGLSQGTGRRMVGRNGLLHPDGAYPQLRRGPAHPLEGNPCRTRMRRGRSRAFTAIMGGFRSVRFRATGRQTRRELTRCRDCTRLLRGRRIRVQVLRRRTMTSPPTAVTSNTRETGSGVATNCDVLNPPPSIVVIVVPSG